MSTPPNELDSSVTPDRQHGELTDHIQGVAHYHRLVIQLADTPHNSQVVARLMRVIAKDIGPVDGPHAVVKNELVVLHEAMFHPELNKSDP